MARDIIQLPTDGSGKKLEAFSYDLGDGLGTRYAHPAVLLASDGTVMHRAYGPARVSQDEHTLFVDTHDAAIDTTDRWNAATGTNAPAVSSSVLTFGTTTTVSIYGKLTSRPTFSPVIPGFTQASFAINVGTSGGVERISGHRFWGLGTSPSTPATTSAATKLTDAIGFEIDTDGKMYAVVYASGVRTAIDLSSSGTGDAASKQPLDGSYHRYLVQIRTDKIYWFIDSLSTPVASMNFTVPSTQSLPILLQTINPGASVAAGGYPLLVQGSVVADTASNHSMLSDGAFPWRKATVLPARTAPDSSDLGFLISKMPMRQPAFQIVSAEVAPAITIGVKDLFSLWHPSTDAKDYYIVEVWVASLITTASTAGRSTILLQFINTIPTGGASPTGQPLLPGGTASGATVMSAKTGGGATTGSVFVRRGWLYATQPLGRVSEKVWEASSLEEAIILPGGSAFGLNVSEERVVAHTALVEQVTVGFKWYEL